MYFTALIYELKDIQGVNISVDSFRKSILKAKINIKID